MKSKSLFRFCGLLACLCVALIAMCNGAFAASTSSPGGPDLYALINDMDTSHNAFASSVQVNATAPEVAVHNSTGVAYQVASAQTNTPEKSEVDTSATKAVPVSSASSEAAAPSSPTYSGPKIHLERSPSASRKMARASKKMHNAVARPLIVHLE